MIKRTVAAVGLAAGLLCVPLSAHAHEGGPMGRPMGPGFMQPLMLRGLNLSNEQRDQIHAIRSGNADQLHSLMKQLREAHEALSTKLLAAGTVQEADLQPDVDRIAALHAQLLQLDVANARAIRGVLTPDQLTSAAERHARWRACEPGHDAMPDEHVD
jgi:Spy/CpxP family protein refolding chaperone